MEILPKNWEFKAFKECFKNISPGDRKIKKRDYLEKGEFPVIDQGEELIGGHTNDNSKLQDLGLPVIVFGDHTRRFKFIDFPFAVGADGTKLLKVNNDLLDYRFAYYQFLQVKIPKKGYSRHFQFLKKINFKVPRIRNEQIRIVQEIETQFTRLDAVVKSLKTLKKKLDVYRKSVLKAAFEGRLILFDDDSKIQSISHYCKKVRQVYPMKEDYDDFLYIDIGSIDNKQMKIINPKEIKSDKAPSRAKQETFPGDIVYSTVRVYLMNVAMVPELGNKHIISSTGFTVLRTNEELNNKFLFYYLLTDGVTKILNSKQRGTSYPAIRDNDLFEMMIKVPKVEIQEQVAQEIESRFSVIDKLEQTINKALKKADQLRKSILKSAFEGKLVEYEGNNNG